jgi:plasmid maintenance system antidote protein VapI
MNSEPSLNPVEFDPNLLLDALMLKYRLKNDAALTRFLEITPSVVSRLRKRKTQLTPGLFIRIHEFTGLSVKELRELMGDHRAYCLLGAGKAGK